MIDTSALEDPEVVPCHWRNGGPIKLAGDIGRFNASIGTMPRD
jgi:hypothetical protein